jgi:signal transduction histidine kinase
VEVELRRETATVLLLKVSDDGKGIGPEEIHSSKALGLLSLRERTAALNGQVEIIGGPGKGTTVAIRVPVEPRAPDKSPGRAENTP